MNAKTSRPTATGITTPDTNNRTYIDWASWSPPSGAEYWIADFRVPKKQAHYKHLDQMNGGLKNGPSWWNQKYFNSQDNQTLIEILSDQLELLTRQEFRAVSFFMKQDLGEWGICKDLVAWSVCAYTVHSDKRDERRSYPAIEKGEKAGQFWDVASSLGLSMKER